MATWGEFEAADADLAALGRRRLEEPGVVLVGTLRRDGWPRISPVEPVIEHGELYLGMMPGSRKLHDLQRDPRLALHSPTEDPPDQRPAGWSGEAKISGRGVPVDAADSTHGARFCIDIGEVVLTHLNDAGDRLVVESWSPGQGRRRIERR